MRRPFLQTLLALLMVAIVGIGCTQRTSNLEQPRVEPPDPILNAEQAVLPQGTWSYAVRQLDGTPVGTMHVRREVSGEGFTETVEIVETSKSALSVPRTYRYTTEGVIGPDQQVVFPPALVPGEQFQDEQVGTWHAEHWVQVDLGDRSEVCLIVRFARASVAPASAEASERCYAAGVGLVEEWYQAGSRRLHKVLTTYSLPTQR